MYFARKHSIMIHAMTPHSVTLTRSVRRRGFAGLAVSQFLGAFNDNAFKMLIPSRHRR
jgi:hypothetical protein